MIDPILSLAVSMHSNKGVYALLLGSGVSRTAGIPTGWEVVLDLIRKLAHLLNEDCEPDPAAWYRNQYQEEPDYSKLLDELAKSPSERSQLLKGYFEPNEEEREQGLKVPTAAHRAIAHLVKKGYIRVILTTNFDKLLERALEAVGVNPTVISTPDAIEGAMPFCHTECSIIKLHGDYLDVRIKNTPTELEKYDERLDKLLDRVFDEYGLIVCGWSGEWDTALRAAIDRCPSRRFTTFWAARREPKEVAKDLFERRKGVFVKIDDADSFFEELSEKVFALQEFNKPHPLSAKIAVTTLKKYLVEERYRIRLHDLVMQEVEKLYSEISPNHLPSGSLLTSEELTKYVQRYESLTEIVLALIANGCYWGDKSQEGLWIRCLERIANPAIAEVGLRATHFNLRLYPALLLLYAGGIASIAAEKYSTFAALLTQPKIRDRNREQPFVFSLCTYHVMERNIAQKLPDVGKNYTPLSDYLYKVLREPLKEFLPQDINYTKCFDRFEYLFALVYTDLNLKQKGLGVGQVRSFYWRRKWGDFNILQEIQQEVSRNSNFENDKSKWLPLQTGLFDNSVIRFQDVKNTFDHALEQNSNYL